MIIDYYLIITTFIMWQIKKPWTLHFPPITIFEKLIFEYNTLHSDFNGHMSRLLYEFDILTNGNAFLQQYNT